MGIKSKTFALLLVALFLLSLCLLLPSTIKTQSKTIVVPNDYTTIQSAINHANNGDTVFVKKGYYPETLVVNKSISIIGEDRNLTVIDGQKKLSQIVLLEADNITFSNFTLGNSGFKPPTNSGWYDTNGMGDGIKIYSSGLSSLQFISITNNIIVDCPYFGIEAGDSCNNSIVGNIIIGKYTGDPSVPNPGLGCGIYVACAKSLFAYNTFVNTTVSFGFHSEGDEGSNTFIENKELTTTTIYSPFSTTMPTTSLWLAIVLLLLFVISIIVLVRHRKTANLKQ